MDGLVVILGAFSFGLGACIASFLNVVIWRVPRGESIVSPPSHCPKCNAAIKWYQNIPILSWLALRGKCANCKAPISPRYIIVEAVGGMLFLGVFWLNFTVYAPYLDQMIRIGYFPYSLAFAILVEWIWVSLMIVGSMIDFDHRLLPDFVTVGGMILGVLASVLSFVLPQFSWFNHPLASLFGLAFGFGLLWLIRFLGSKAFKREAMGMGDVFLMGAVGALFGPMAVLFVLIFSSLFGSVIGVSLIALSKTKFGKFVEIPYGPYICLATLLWMFYGVEIVRWYLGLMK